MKPPSRPLLCTFLGTTLALTALAEPAHAGTRMVSPDRTDVGLVRPRVLDVRFDGIPLSEGFVLRLAKRPVVAWGGIRDDDGTALVEGELWFIVARDDAFVYYHLTEDPNPNTGPTAYGGYTVKAKGIQEVRAYNLGAGEEVPVIGNDRDGFVTTTTELRVNSKFTLAPRAIDLSTGKVVSSDHLVHVLDEVRVYNIPYAASAGRWMGWQALAPDGSVLDEFSTGQIASSSSSDCVAAAQSARTFVASTTVTAAQALQLALGTAAGGAMASGATGRPGPIGMAGTVAIGLGLRAQFALQNAAAKVADDVTAPVYASLAEAACELIAGTSNPDLSLIEPDLPSVEDIEFVEPKLKCLSYGDEAAGSSMEVTDDGIEVHGHTNRVCKEWVFVVE